AGYRCRCRWSGRGEKRRPQQETTMENVRVNQGEPASAESTERVSRLPGFYKLSVAERVRLLNARGLVSREDFRALAGGKHQLTAARADKMIENVIGVLGMPVGLGLNSLINVREYVVPLAVAEPSIDAALSSAAKLVRQSGGFRT